jgi:hypothetical protein
VDRDGKFKYSSVVRIAREQNGMGIYLQTGIINDRIVLMNPANANVRKIEIIDASGRLISAIKFNNNSSQIFIPADKLASGIYFVKITGVDGQIEVVRVVKH